MKTVAWHFKPYWSYGKAPRDVWFWAAGHLEMRVRILRRASFYLGAPLLYTNSRIATTYCFITLLFFEYYFYVLNIH